MTALTPSPKPLRDVVADHLRDQIIGGDLRPGQRVREDEIADAHGVSRVPAREAVQRLATEGYLELIPFRGAIVAKPSADHALQLMQVRRALETMAARLTAQQRGGSVARDLNRLVQRGNRAAASNAHAMLPDLVNEFHRLVALGARNDALVALLDEVRDKVRWMFAVDLHERACDSWVDHRLILEAIVEGDEDEAARLMDAHVAKDEALYRAKFAGVLP